MSTRSQLTKDLNESIKSTVGNKVKILFKNVVRLETKGDKTENRVLVFSPCRILLLIAKVPTKIDCHFHYLEIQALESKRGNHLSLTINDKVYSFLTGEDSTCSTEVDNMIGALNNAIRNIFPTMPLQHIIRKVEVIPSSRLQQLRDLEAIASSRREVGPCGGFSTQYACYCDYHGMTYRDEVAWDIDNIYFSLNTRELNLKDFEYLDQKDLIPVISALEYNTWFTKLRANQVKLSHDNIEKILHMLRKSLNLEELYMDNLGLKSDFVNKLSNTLKLNPDSALHSIDLSFNPIEDKGASYLSQCINRLSKGVVHVNVSHCGLSSKGVNNVANAICGNTINFNSLTYLNLSGNSLKDDISHLHNLLSQANALQYIDISSTDVILENLFGALVKGCTTNLVHLNVARNPFSSKKSKEAPISFKQFFSTTLNLKYLNMSHCKLPQEALKNLLLGLACNEFTKEMNLDISNNGLGSQGAHVLESCVHGVRCISSLDISDNNMDSDLCNVVLAISKNKSLKHLNMGRSMKKHMSLIMDAVVQVIQEDDCILQSLIIPDCRLRSDLFNLLNALGDNKSLEVLDISGNLIGDSGARLLAKALQINGKLRTIVLDRNNITLQGYNDIAYALESNRTLQYIPFPIFDVTPCMKASAERTDILMRKIQDQLNRNVCSKKQSTKHTSLQPGFLLTSKQQALDRLVSQTQEAIKSFGNDTISSNNDINHANDVIQDAENCKQLLVRLQEVAQHRNDKHPVEEKLQQVSKEIFNSVCDSIQVIIDKMLKTCKEQCPYVLRNEQTVTEIKSECKKKKQIPLDYVTSCVKHQAGVDIMNRLRELNLMVASQLSEQVTDEVYEALMQSYKILVGDESAIRIDSPPRRSRLSSTDSSRHGASDMSITDSTSHISDHSPLATPHLSIKRKSVHNRKLRPKSVVDSVEGLSADDIPSLLPSLPRNSEEEDSVTELPNTSYHLQHLVKGIFLNKGRPRRAKTRAPTRPVVKPPDVTDLVSQDLVEGLDTFFRPGSVTPTSDDCHSFHLDGSPNHEYSSPILSEDRKTPKLSRNSPLLRGLMTPTPRSRSTDNLEKCSPSMMRKNAGDSPLSRRLTGDSLLSQESSEGSLATESTFDHSPSSTLSKRVSPDSFKENSDPSKLKLKPTPAIAQKPRPWSMVNNTESKSADLSLLSDGSSPNNSTGNTPDSAEALDSSESSSIDRKIAKDIKLKRSGILQSYFPDRGDFKFLSRYKGIITKPGQSSSTNQERRDSNFNCSSREDAHTVR
ncbi:capping protein regulator and myosin 1 linker 1 leucine rich repeat protein isoform X1 [Rhynchophorus ferrugineus]|uniref:capping protein regulator and myosin 1 linker 1 leucine rich repeat protein isoform X1 n=1 Tax=Rhynchophorus ferrugineus TaxID=354439 RepID=UPI003FCC8D8B